MGKLNNQNSKIRRYKQAAFREGCLEWRQLCFQLSADFVFLQCGIPDGSVINKMSRLRLPVSYI